MPPASAPGHGEPVGAVLGAHNTGLWFCGTPVGGPSGSRVFVVSTLGGVLNINKVLLEQQLFYSSVIDATKLLNILAFSEILLNVTLIPGDQPANVVHRYVLIPFIFSEKLSEGNVVCTCNSPVVLGFAYEVFTHQIKYLK